MQTAPIKHKWYYDTQEKVIVNRKGKVHKSFTYIAELSRSAIDFIAKEKRIPVKQS